MTIAAIIPAYNEDKTIQNVINVLKVSRLINEIIVVSDGSTDDTVNVSKRAGAKVIELETNKGKGGAMLAGVEKCNSDVMLFLDADLVGLKAHHIHNLLTPILNNEAQMTIGVFCKGRPVTDFAQKIAPFLSGQRAMRKELIENLSDLEISKFGVEVALTRYANKNSLCVKEVILEDVTHIMKEEKLGFSRGFAARLKMYWEIAKIVFSW
ncbi:MAG: glycosyltransferase family 2 protein [Clostridia bacterium]|nr:glycosyltransferase family 2 protein [Clostridia bacterium]